MLQKSLLIYEKTRMIPIPQKMTIPEFNQYGLKEHTIDPFKSSPPNDFMQKLYSRMDNYKSFNKNVYNLDKE
jgi:hypothetical protein